MGIGEVAVSAWAATVIVILAIGATALAIVYRLLYPRLDKFALRLSGAALVAAVLALAAAAAIPPSWSHAVWLFNFEAEWNIPSAVMSTQLALAGSVALIVARLRSSAGRGPWVYFLGIGLVLFFFAVEDHTELYKVNSSGFAALFPWWAGYNAMSTAMLTVSVGAALHSRPESRAWHICLAAGIALWGFAAFVVDAMVLPCGLPGLLRIDGCLKTGVIEESLEFLGVWLALVAMLGIYSEMSPAANSRSKLALVAIPPIWCAFLIAISPFTPIAPVAAYANAQPASATFESGERLHGYLLEQGSHSLSVHLFLSSNQWRFENTGYSITLIDQVSKVAVASSDNYATGELAFSPRLAYIPLYRQWTALDLAPDAVVNRAFWLVMSLWRMDDGNYVRQKALTSDRQLLDETQILLAEMTFPQNPRTREALARFDPGFALEAVNLPSLAESGATLNIPFSWRSDVKGQEDYVQFLHFVHEETGDWWGFDQQPLGPRLPTRLWYKWLADSEIWQVPLPVALAPGPYAVYTGLYRADNHERLPAGDAAGTPWPDNRVALGTIVID